MQQIVNELLSTAALCDARFFAHAEEKNDWSDFTALCIFYVSVNVKYVNGSAFLAAPHNLGLMMNVDCFSPFKHTPYSVGAVYLSVMNQNSPGGGIIITIDAQRRTVIYLVAVPTNLAHLMCQAEPNDNYSWA